MAKGRKPKPTNIKKLEGNPGKRKLNENEPIYTSDVPDCPDWMLDNAKAEWRRMYPQLSHSGVLTSVDYAVFSVYCQSWARWVEAEEFVSKYGQVYKNDKGVWKEVPQVNMSLKYGAQMMRAAVELGITPSSRARITTGILVSSTPIDEMEGLLN